MAVVRSASQSSDVVGDGLSIWTSTPRVSLVVRVLCQTSTLGTVSSLGLYTVGTVERAHRAATATPPVPVSPTAAPLVADPVHLHCTRGSTRTCSCPQAVRLGSTSFGGTTTSRLSKTCLSGEAAVRGAVPPLLRLARTYAAAGRADLASTCISQAASLRRQVGLTVPGLRSMSWTPPSAK